MIWDEVQIYINIVEVDETKNILVDNIFIWDNLIVQKNYYKFSNFKI